jgi:release factor family 10
MTVTREQVRELAQFEDAAASAVSFYFQPSAARNRAHKEDGIVLKDLAREALTVAAGNGAIESARPAVDRILQRWEELRGKATQAKAMFACSGKEVWREFDLPATLSSPQLFIGRHFHLKPLAEQLNALPRLGIALVDRHRARTFDLVGHELTEREGMFRPLPRRGRGDGYAGYEGGHAQRRVEDEVRHHYKLVAAVLKDSLERGVFEKWVLGCHETQRTHVEAQLHPTVAEALIGNFPADLAHISLKEMRARAEQALAAWQSNRCTTLVTQTLAEARSRGRGATGLRRVLRALELGEVQTLLLGEHLQAHAVECRGCGHLDAHLVSTCPVCGRSTEEVVDVAEAILPRVISSDVELLYVKSHAEFDRVGNIAALLRFRSHDVAQILPAVADRLRQAGSVYPGRLRRFASR